MKYDITALGEILIDFTPVGEDTDKAPLFARKAGGAPLNLLATVARFGGKTAFIGKVGNDMFGDFLKSTVKTAGISDCGIVTDMDHNTTLAFVSLDKNGDRDFSFFRNYGADVFLEKEDIDCDIIENSKIFHFGSLSLTTDPARTATEYALSVAKKAGCIISYDPNYRAPLWKNEKTAAEMMKKHLDKVDILKIAREELEMLFGADSDAAVRKLQAYGITVILVTDGGNGATLYIGNGHLSLPAEKVKPVDTTGAGDIFFGTFLSEWTENENTLESITFADACRYLKTAIRIAGKSTEHYGAIVSIPERKEDLL